MTEIEKPVCAICGTELSPQALSFGDYCSKCGTWEAWADDRWYHDHKETEK